MNDASFVCGATEYERQNKCYFCMQVRVNARDGNITYACMCVECETQRTKMISSGTLSHRHTSSSGTGLFRSPAIVPYLHSSLNLHFV